jgi:N-succinyldiaminopimelate aminotransferase
MLGLLEPGDEVIVFEPFYDAYPAAIAMAGATPRYVPLRPQCSAEGAPGRFAFDPDDLAAAVTDRTRAILLNTPHNPTGTVFTRAELERIAQLCNDRDLLAITDEVYEHLVYDDAHNPGAEHVRLATLPGMHDRTATISSLGKTFALTGWKIGWVVGGPRITAAVRAAHQYMQFSVATPLQHAAAEALSADDAFFTDLAQQYAARRDLLANALEDAGFRFARPAGGYFILCEHAAVAERLGVQTDVDLASALIDRIGVAAIPPSFFYQPEHRDLGRALIRFAFCKSESVLHDAAERLRQLSE